MQGRAGRPLFLRTQVATRPRNDFVIHNAGMVGHEAKNGSNALLRVCWMNWNTSVLSAQCHTALRSNAVCCSHMFAVGCARGQLPSLVSTQYEGAYRSLWRRDQRLSVHDELMHQARHRAGHSEWRLVDQFPTARVAGFGQRLQGRRITSLFPNLYTTPTRRFVSFSLLLLAAAFFFFPCPVLRHHTGAYRHTAFHVKHRATTSYTPTPTAAPSHVRQVDQHFHDVWRRCSHQLLCHRRRVRKIRRRVDLDQPGPPRCVNHEVIAVQLARVLTVHDLWAREPTPTTHTHTPQGR